jgi:antitoxin component HigA of HigAB toxin-antitoxin module
MGAIRGNRAMVTLDFIETLKQVLETRGVRQADMSYVVASMWTQDQVPEIRNEDQYQEYLTLWHRLSAAAGLPTAKNFTRSREGIYLDSVAARLIEWEERAKSGHRPEAASPEEILDFIRAGFRSDGD